MIVTNQVLYSPLELSWLTVTSTNSSKILVLNTVQYRYNKLKYSVSTGNYLSPVCNCVVLLISCEGGTVPFNYLVLNSYQITKSYEYNLLFCK